MTRSMPYLALDSAGKRTILCDYPVKMFDNTTKEKKAKMAHVMTNQEVQSHTKKLVARLLGQDAAVDDETAARIKEFLSDKLSDKDHTALCAMLNGEDNVEAEDTEPAPDDVELPKNAIKRPLKRSTAADAKADFHRRYPGLAAVRIDNSGIQPPARAAKYSAADAASFAARFPGLARVRLL
jgi:hypothetical protein